MPGGNTEAFSLLKMFSSLFFVRNCRRMCSKANFHLSLSRLVRSSSHRNIIFSVNSNSLPGCARRDGVRICQTFGRRNRMGFGNEKSPDEFCLLVQVISTFCGCMNSAIHFVSQHILRVNGFQVCVVLSTTCSRIGKRISYKCNWDN